MTTALCNLHLQTTIGFLNGSLKLIPGSYEKYVNIIFMAQLEDLLSYGTVQPIILATAE